ncbi:HEAT repeat domain-containing protein [Streptomyces xanthophaeus]|uniref:HEAT repeat domain-containing protein n=1 Tax=Streptomyces xanthophaeus TaxID=67385 RepID=UPI0004CDD9F1|nr:HEAT repeat domain-containing protein [Streptomyces xanthophaeus]
MIELDDFDWSATDHAYGPADEVPELLAALASADAEVRRKALSRYYGAVHHQGDVYACTTASLPFLFALAADPAAPDRAPIVQLLVSIGSNALEHCAYDDRYGAQPEDHVTAAVDAMRAHVEDFVRLAGDADPRTREAAVPALGLFLEDADRAVALLGDRLPLAHGTTERLLVVETMATLALRLPAALVAATARLTALAADAAADPTTRLAALVHRARCAPQDIGEGVVPAAIGLLRAAGAAPAADEPDDRTAAPDETATPAADATPTPAPAATPAADVPPQIAAAFEELDRHHRVHAPTTDLLHTFHAVLGSRVSERTTLLAEQLRSPDPGSRYDAIRMSKDLVQSWRGDHTALLLLVSEHLLPDDPYTAAEAARALSACHPVAGPAREALAAYVLAQRAAHGPDVWATPKPLLRRAHQEAVLALAELGDVRALPGLLTALDSGVDAWRAVQVAGRLPQAAQQLVPRLCDRLGEVDLSDEWPGTGAGTLLSALAALGDPAAVPAITDTLTAAMGLAQRGAAVTALKALATLAAAGPRAAPDLAVIRPLARADDQDVRIAALALLWVVTGDRDEIVPLVDDVLDSALSWNAAELLGRIGPPAARALPRLREMLDDEYEWTRVHAATGLWDIGGEVEGPGVVRALVEAWESNGATANAAVECLARMGAAAAPALPRIRAELALARRGGRYSDISHDEALQRACRALVTQLG